MREIGIHAMDIHPFDNTLVGSHKDIELLFSDEDRLRSSFGNGDIFTPASLEFYDTKDRPPCLEFVLMWQLSLISVGTR